MLRPLLYRLLLGVTVAAVLAGCTVSAAGQAAPAPGDAPDTRISPDEPDSDELPTDGAPKVDDPLDTTQYQEDPCLSLTSDQSEGIFGFSATGRPLDSELGKACQWKNESTRAYTEVHFLDKDPRGLSAQYAVNEEGRWVFFKELTVQGQPAVARGLVDRREDGICSVVVGASDEIAFEVVLQQSEDKVGTKDPCTVAADIAGEAVTTMKAG